MVEQATSLVDRFDTARERIDEEVQRVQKEIKTRRKRIEKQIASGRKNIEKQTRKQVKQIETDLKKNQVVQQLERVRDEAGRQVETVLETVLGALQIASKGDVNRIDRKLTKLNKRLKDIERSRKGNGQAPGPIAQV
jgi:hypothetical protein